jgi:hypothetical protein
MKTKATISSVKYEIRYDPKSAGGITDLSNKVITVGTANKKDARNILYHEAVESIMHERGLRYSRYEEGNDGVIFSLTHHDFENLIADLLVVIDELK